MKHPTLALLTGLGVAALAAFAATAQTANQPGQYNQAQRTIRGHAGLDMSAATPLDLSNFTRAAGKKISNRARPMGFLGPEQRKRFAIFRIAMSKRQRRVR